MAAKKLYGVAQIDDGAWEKLVPKFIHAGFDMDWMERTPRRSRGPGPETATVALDVRSYSGQHRQAMLAHRTQISPESFLVNLPPELRRLAFATAYFIRLSPPWTLGNTNRIFLTGWTRRSAWCEVWDRLCSRLPIRNGYGSNGRFRTAFLDEV